MHRARPGRPQARSLGALLQSPAHRVLRVLLVTRAHWQVQQQMPHVSHAPRALHGRDPLSQPRLS